jgi:DNA sulfur modification protein DndB
MQISLPDPPFHVGVPIFGSVITETEFQGAMPHGLFRSFVPDPRRLEGSRAKHHADLSPVATLRSRVQRLVTGAKRKNVEPYARYIIEMKKTGEGFTPQIVLWTDQRLRVEQDPQTGVAWALVPHSLKFIALDGDTQTTARSVADELQPGLFSEDLVKVVIKHGTREDIAQQIFADCNAKGVKVSVSMAIGFDTRDDATLIAKYTERHIPRLDGKVNRQKRQLAKSDADLITISALRGGVVCLIEGIAGVQNQTDGVAIPDDRIELYRRASVQWFSEVEAAFGDALSPERRPETFASAPAVWAAVGALAHDALSALMGENAEEPDEEEVEAAFSHIAQEYLHDIDWGRSERWLSVGAKRSSSGAITLGGPKETGSLIYRGLREHTLKANRPVATAADQ